MGAERFRILREERKGRAARRVAIQNRVVDDGTGEVEFGGGARFRRDHRQPRTHRFRETESKRLEGGGMQEQIPGSQKCREFLSVFLKTQQLNVRALLCLFLDPDTFGTVAKNEQFDVGLEGDAIEHREDDVPAFFTREAAGGDQ